MSNLYWLSDAQTERLKSNAGVWVTRPHQAARFSATLAATPSVTL